MGNVKTKQVMHQKGFIFLPRILLEVIIRGQLERACACKNDHLWQRQDFHPELSK